MKDKIKELRYEVLHLQNMGEISIKAESKLLHKLNGIEEQLRIGGVSDMLIAWEQFKKANWYESEAIDVEKMLMDKFQAIYGR